MKLVLMGSGAFGLPTFEALRVAHDIVGVVSQSDKPAGRKRKLTATPVAQWALDHALPLLRTDNVQSEEAHAWLERVQPDFSVVIAFGQKLSPETIAASGELVINLHSSLLPAYRGAAPVHHAVLDGLSHTGVSVIGLAQVMDAGEVYGQASLEIDASETTGELHDRLSEMGPEVVIQVLQNAQNNILKAVPQDPSKATYARKLSKADATVDFNQPADKVRATINGLTPWPGCRVWWHKNATEPQELFLRRAIVAGATDLAPGICDTEGCVGCADGQAIQLLELQLPGKKKADIDVFMQGHPFEQGQYLAPFYLA